MVDKMRKIYAGGQDFPSQAQVYRNIIEFWKKVIKRKQAVLKSQAALRALDKQLKIPITTQKRMTEETAKHKLKTAYQAYFHARPNLPKWREEFQVGLVQALASDWDKSPKVILALIYNGGKSPEIFDKRIRKPKSYGQQQPIATARSTNTSMKRTWW